ncbi:MAG: hypothetical protein O6947_00380 [Acidobacteria bacterium]|nr:hypothetical protein [Acidobacteriota bacterium]
MPINFDTLQNLAGKIREAEALIRQLREENNDLRLQLERYQSGEIPAVPFRAEMEQQSRIRTSVHRVLNLLDRIEH